MNKESASKLWKVIQEAGLYLQSKLQDHPNHSKGKNAFAHVALCIKNKFGMSYKDIANKDYKKVIEYIDFFKKNPN